MLVINIYYLVFAITVQPRLLAVSFLKCLLVNPEGKRAVWR